tara:strand:- start:4040 stop:5173 length:1134 start_codon:yes stop_codon:yes gene_type:complete
MNKTVCVNVTTLVNKSKIRKEKRGGRDVIIIPSVTLPDNVVMNGIRYPAEEIAKSYKSLDRTQAPFGHPMINGKWTSASDPEAINAHYIGAWNENPRQENGKVLLDKVIDVEVANRSENGKKVLNAVEKEEPIHTSTGLVAALTNLENDEEAQFTAHDLIFDHDAILIGEAGAATPEQGVGMLVNGEHSMIINSRLDEESDQEIDWAIQSMMRALERKRQVPVMQRVKEAIIEAFSVASDNPEPEENAEMANEKEFTDLNNRVTGIETKIDGLGDIIANALKEAIAPMAETMTQLGNSMKAKDEEVKAGLVNKVVTAGILTEETAKNLDLTALTELANKAEPKSAANAKSGVLNADDGDGKDEFSGYDLNVVNGGKE